MAIVMFAISMNISKLFAVKTCMILTMTIRIGQGQMHIEKPYMTCCLIVTVIFSRSVIISNIFTVKMRMTLTLQFRIGQLQM